MAGTRVQEGDSIDILGLAQFRAQVMFGVLRHVSTSSALVLNLAQNAAQFGAQDFQCLLNRPQTTKESLKKLWTKPAVILFLFVFTLGYGWGVRDTYLFAYLQDELGASSSLISKSYWLGTNHK